MSEQQREATDHAALMDRAIARAAHSRLLAPPNPWVGCLVVTADGTTFEGGTQRPGGLHAERVALARAGHRARGATLYATLEPCSHTGRTGPCTEAIIEAGIEHVVIGVLDPDPNVSGSGVRNLLDSGVSVTLGVGAASVTRQLEPYLHHRRTGRPYVVAKMAATLDGRTAAADGSSQWITNEAARADVHRLRAESDAILVGAGTVRSDNPRLTVRGVIAADGLAPRDPQRIVLGRAEPGAAVHPCHEHRGELGPLLDRLGADGIVQLMVEGGAATTHAFHRAELIDRHVVYLGLALMGGSDGSPVLDGPGAATMAEITRGRLAAHRVFDGTLEDPSETVRIDLIPHRGP